MPAIVTLLPVRMHITIPRSLRDPMAMNRDITPAFPTPVPPGPEVTRSPRGLYLDNAFRRRLRCDDLNIFTLHRTPVMNDPFLHTTRGGNHHC
jgi:hypothetical protein